MPDAIQRSQSRVDNDAKTAKRKELEVGDIVKLRDDKDYVITEVNRDKKLYKGEPVKFENGRWQLDKSRTAAIFSPEDVKGRYAQSKETKEFASLIFASQEKSHESTTQKKPEKEEHEHAVSFEVTSNGSPDGFVKGGNSYSRIVTGTTKNGVIYSALGGSLSRDSIEARVDAIADNHDLHGENADERQAVDDINDATNQVSDAVEIVGGPTVNRNEFGSDIEFEVTSTLKEDELDSSNPHSAEPEYDERSLEEILADTKYDGQSVHGGYIGQDLDDDDEPEIGFDYE